MPEIKPGFYPWQDQVRAVGLVGKEPAAVEGRRHCYLVRSCRCCTHGHSAREAVTHDCHRALANFFPRCQFVDVSGSVALHSFRSERPGEFSVAFPAPLFSEVETERQYRRSPRAIEHVGHEHGITCIRQASGGLAASIANAADIGIKQNSRTWSAAVGMKEDSIRDAIGGANLNVLLVHGLPFD